MTTAGATTTIKLIAILKASSIVILPGGGLWAFVNDKRFNDNPVYQ
jgi:hypothetical protein